MKEVHPADHFNIPNSSISFRFNVLIPFGLILALVLASCTPSFTSDPTITSLPPTPTPIPATQTPVPTPTLISPEAPFFAWIDPALPEQIRNGIGQSDFLEITATESSAQLIISQNPGPEAGSWLYLAVAPFYSHTQETLSADLLACWTGKFGEGLSFRQILVTENTRGAFEFLWGPASEDCVITVGEEAISQRLWLEQDILAIVPFDQVQPGYKVLRIDQFDPLSNDFDRTDYPLVLRFSYQISPGYKIEFSNHPQITNYDQSKLTSIALTGVTALVRDTANIMEEKGITYPAADIKDILVNADITHINNEVPFAEDCPSPETYQVSLRFCSADSYINLLEAVGTDIVELSGDHFGDWGSEAMYHTLDLYNQKNWVTYGGGETLSDGLAPVYLSHNENHFAFIGCNGKGIDRYATATDDEPGAAQCDFKWMIPEISRLTSEGYIVIATMQHEEVDSFGSIALQQYDFRRLAEAGAVIVSGSQSHHPQAIEFTGSSFIHYGLGNLFFDQWFLAHYNPKLHINKDKSFIDMHYFYDGNYIGTRLIPLQFIDNARPRPMTLEERIPFMEEFYKYSLWNGEWIHLYSTGYMYNRTDQ